MAKDWSSVRLQRKTLERLTAMRRGLLESYILGRIKLPDDQVDGVTVDWVLNWLLDQVESHRERAKRQKRQKPPKLHKGQDSAE